MKPNKFMRRAVELSLRNAHSAAGGPFGCVIVKADKIVGEGMNRVTRDCDSTAHGEIVAMRNAQRKLGKPDLKGCILYTSSQPCPGCKEKIKGANISKIYYANTRRAAGNIGFADDEIARRKIPTIRMPDPLALSAFEIWVANPERKMYYKRKRKRRKKK